MLRILLMAIFVLLAACSTGDTASDIVAHRYFTIGEPVLHTRRTLLEFSPHRLGGQIIVGPVELIGNGILHVGAADYRPIDNHVRSVRIVDTHNMRSPLLIEAQFAPDDSLTLLMNFSYTQQDDSVIELVSGTLHIPLENDSVALFHKLQLQGQPFYEAEPRQGCSQQLMLDLDYLLM